MRTKRFTLGLLAAAAILLPAKASAAVEWEAPAQLIVQTTSGGEIEGETSKSCTLQCNDDGTYTMKGWYGIEGFDFSFTLNENNKVVVLGEDDWEKGSLYGCDLFTVPNGTSDVTTQLSSIMQSAFEGTIEGGSMAVMGSRAFGDAAKSFVKYSFTWTKGEAPTVTRTPEWEAPAQLIVQTTSGGEIEGETSKSCTLQCYDDGTYTMKGWYGIEGFDFSFTINENNKVVVLGEDDWAKGSIYGCDLFTVPNGTTDITTELGSIIQSSFEGSIEGGSMAIMGSRANGDAAKNFVKYSFTWTKGEAPTPSEDKKVAWTQEGTFLATSTTGEVIEAMPEWRARIYAYTDGTYKIQNWRGTEGYDLEFKVNENNKIEITNDCEHFTQSFDVFKVPTGDDIAIDVWSVYGSAFAGTEAEGELYFAGWYYLNDNKSVGKFTFTWPAAVKPVLAWSKDVTASFGEKTFSTKLERYSDGSYCVPAWMGADGYDLTFKLNSDNTLHFTGTEADGYVSVDSSANSTLKLKQDGESSFTNEDEWGEVTATTSDKEVYTLSWGIKPATKLWEKEVTMTAYNIKTDEPDASWGSDRGQAEWTDILEYYDDNSYKLVKWLGSYPLDLPFTVNEDNTIHFTYSDETTTTSDGVRTPIPHQMGTDGTAYQDSKSYFYIDEEGGRFMFTSPSIGDYFKGTWGNGGPVVGINSAIAADNEAVYYDLTGIRISNPAKGTMVIRILNNKASKIVVR